MGNSLLNLLFPRRCVSCGRLGKYFCFECRRKIKPIEYQVCSFCERPAIGGVTHPKCKTRSSLDGLTSIWVYDGPMKRAIKELKYRLVTDLANELVNLSFGGPTSQEVGPLKEPLGEFVLTPVPLHSSRLRWRGFNQAEVLGRMLAEKLGIKFIPDLLIRKRATRPQVELKGKERKENIADAFAINRRTSNIYDLSSKILLFDDVWTTGATLRTCGNVLKRAGVQWVWGLTLAR